MYDTKKDFISSTFLGAIHTSKDVWGAYLSIHISLSLLFSIAVAFDTDNDDVLVAPAVVANNALFCFPPAAAFFDDAILVGLHFVVTLLTAFALLTVVPPPLLLPTSFLGFFPR
jgi:hypothetical protein